MKIPTQRVAKRLSFHARLRENLQLDNLDNSVDYGARLRYGALLPRGAKPTSRRRWAIVLSLPTIAACLLIAAVRIPAFQGVLNSLTRNSNATPSVAECVIPDILQEAGTALSDSAKLGRPPTAAEIDYFMTLIEQNSQRTGIPSALVHALAMAESRWYPEASNSSGAAGFLQVKPPTAAYAGFNVTDGFSSEEQIQAGLAYLRQLQTIVDQFPGIPDRERYRLMLAGFHGGHNALRALLQEAKKQNLPLTLDVIAQLRIDRYQMPPDIMCYASRIMHWYDNPDIVAQYLQVAKGGTESVRSGAQPRRAP